MSFSRFLLLDPGVVVTMTSSSVIFCQVRVMFKRRRLRISQILWSHSQPFSQRLITTYLLIPAKHRNNSRSNMPLNTANIYCRRKVRQGGVLSPYLFALYNRQYL